MDFTIVIKYEMMVMIDGAKKGSRLMFRGPGINVYVMGPLEGKAFEQAANLAMNKAQDMHIPVRSLKTVKYPVSRKLETNTKRMF